VLYTPRGFEAHEHSSFQPTDWFPDHVLHKPRASMDLVKPSKGQRLPDIVTVEEARQRSRLHGCSATACSPSPSSASGGASARGWR
jgi:hypothetical protein